ncbi:MAG: hypothetical protein ICV64_09460 [Thermoleophilia bacterium]|nr:hypothetical protein [Thermoleophilia bacterium]
MGTLLGLLGVVAFVVGVVGLSAAVTFAVVKLTPPKRPDAPVTEPSE